jgi:hypothetical protein
MLMFTFVESRYGLGRHVWTIPEEDNLPYLKVEELAPK